MSGDKVGAIDRISAGAGDEVDGIEGMSAAGDEADGIEGISAAGDEADGIEGMSVAPGGPRNASSKSSSVTIRSKISVGNAIDLSPTRGFPPNNAV